MLDVIDLECVRGDRALFRGLSFSLKAGEFAHIRGHNGAGKTSLLRLICGLSRQAKGEVRWQNHPISSLDDLYRRQLVYVGHLDGVQGELTARENLRYSVAIYGDQTNAPPDPAALNRVLRALALQPVADLPAKFLSQGQRRRLALARLRLLGKALWIMDEPYTALDGRATALLDQWLSAHLAGGGLALMASHQTPGVKVARYINLGS